MEERNQRHDFPSKQCQIEGCEEISVGSKVPLCRKHRNKTYKQNYKKKKRNAEVGFEENPQEIVIDDQYLLEQKYSNMLQDVLTQKQMELFESPCVVNLLKNYQQQKLVSRNNPKNNGISSSSFSTSGKSNYVEQRKQDVEGVSSSQPGNRPCMNEMTISPAINFTQCSAGDWNEARSSMSSKVIMTCNTPSLSSLSSSSLQRPPCSSYISASTTFQGDNVP